MADGSIRIETRLDNSKLTGDLNNYKKAIDNTVKSIERDIANSGKEIDRFTDKFQKTNSELAEVGAKMDEIQNSKMDFSGVGSVNLEQLLASDNAYQKLSQKLNQLNKQSEEYKGKIESATNKQTGLKNTLNKVKKKQEGVNQEIQKGKEKAEDLNKSMKKTVKSSKNMSSEITGGVKKLAKYALALMSIRGIYSLVSRAMSEWLNSSDESAKQLKADLDNLKTNIGSALAPALQGVLNIFYKILAVVGAIVKAFSGINLFAKNTAKSTGTSAKNNEKQLTSIDEITKLSSNSGGSGDDAVSATDLSSMMAQYEELAQKVKNIFEFIFEPFKKAWETEGQGVIESINNAFAGIKDLISAIGNSFAKIWTNGTVQKMSEVWFKTLKSIFNIIGNIGKALSEAWENNDAGDTIIQGLADAFINSESIILGIYETFEQWTGSENFQVFSNSIISIIETLISWFTRLTDMLKNIWENGGKETFSKLLDVFGKVIEAVSAILSALQPVFDWIIATIEPVLEGIIEVIGHVLDALGGLLDFIVGVFTGDWEKAWNGIKDFFIGTWNATKTFVTTIWNFIVDITKQKIEQVKNIIQTISDGIRNTISNVLNAIQTTWNNIWSGLKTTVVNIFNGIWETIKGVINSILGGIEGMANGVVKGINKVIDALNRIQFTIPDWVPGFGGKSWGLNIGRLSEITIPKLAKGGIVMQPTQAIVGEAGKEAVLPLENNTEWMDILAGKIADKINIDTDGGTYTFIAKLDEDILFKKVFQKKNGYNFATNGGVL